VKTKEKEEYLNKREDRNF